MRSASNAKEKEQRISQTLKPRILQAIDQQKYLFENFDRIKQDTELLPELFRTEALMRTRALDAQKKAEANAQIAMDKMDQL